MAADHEDTQRPEVPSETDAEVVPDEAKAGPISATTEDELHDGTPAQLGATKYVHAAFLGAGVLTAYLSGKVLASVWNLLAEQPTIAEAVPQLLQYSEDERATFSMVAGAAIGLLLVVQTYRKEHIRRWADEVATELSKVTWPNKETVTNGTFVVIVATAIGTVYVALLDRFWSFVTNLVYNA
jgi:preprotein translocase SecE subunit